MLIPGNGWGVDRRGSVSAAWWNFLSISVSVPSPVPTIAQTRSNLFAARTAKSTGDFPRTSNANQQLTIVQERLRDEKDQLRGQRGGGGLVHVQVQLCQVNLPGKLPPSDWTEWKWSIFFFQFDISLDHDGAMGSKIEKCVMQVCNCANRLEENSFKRCQKLDI